ncbi:hypothetical protein CDV55_107559 [Aspergillus turcosus]|nr:hypothetical protein CDV55_107559 [Aspergillus turcosus]
MKCQNILAIVIGCIASTSAVSVSGAAEGFAKGVTGGGSATAVYPSTNAELVSYLGDSQARVIVLTKTFDFTGTEGTTTATGCAPWGTASACQLAINLNNWCTNYEPNAPSVSVTYDNAGVLGITVNSNKSLLGSGSSGVIKGKGLRIVSGASNIIIQNIAITDINPKYVWGGDALTIDNADMVWIDHVTTARIGRQHLVLGTSASNRVTISNNYFNGVTSYSATCDGYHYWGIYLDGSNDLVTMKSNYIYHFSGRSPKVQGNTLLHAVNNYWYDSTGHAFEIGSGGYVLAEGNVFQNINTIVESPVDGQLFTSPDSTTNKVCSTYLGHVCQVNGFGSSGTFSQADTGFLANFAGKNVASASAYTVVQSSVPSNAGQGRPEPHRVRSAVELTEGVVGDNDGIQRARSDSRHHDPEFRSREILLNADEFATKYDLGDIRHLLRQGALLLDDPDSYMQREGLTEEDRAALANERFSQSRHIPFANSRSDYALHAAAFALGLPAAVFTILISRTNASLEGTQYVLNLLCPFAFVVGLWLAHPLDTSVGRRGAACIAAVLSMTSGLGRFLLQAQQAIHVIDIIYFAGCGIIVCELSLYLAETSLPSSRSAVLARFLLLHNAGFAIGTVTLINLSYLSSSITGPFVAIPGAICLLCFSTLPESPRLCIAQGDMRSAYETMCRLTKVKVQAARDTYQIYISAETGDHCLRLRDFLTVPALRRAALSSAAVAFACSLVSIGESTPQPGVLGNTETYAAEGGPLMVILILLGAIFTVRIYWMLIMSTSLKRRRLYLHVQLAMLVFLVLSQPAFKQRWWIAVQCAAGYMLVALSAISQLITVIYAAEVFPLRYRSTYALCPFGQIMPANQETPALGMALGTSVWLLTTAILQLIDVYLPVSLSSVYVEMSYPFIAFALCAHVLALIAVYLLMVETHDRTLEEISAGFETPMRNILAYRIRLELPHILKRSLLGKRSPLQPFEESRYNTGGIVLPTTGDSP